MKRAFDFLAALVVLVVALPLMLLVALALFLVQGWPVLFTQTRPGLLGAPFRLYKFRTMRAGPGTDAERLTRIGRIVRALSLDELPQLVNVLKGDMSLVGPRPLLMEYNDRYSPEQRRRLDAVPGITGWAQVNGRNAISWEQKFELDVWYVDHRSFWLDLKILALTAWRVLTMRGIRQAGHATMEEFRGSSARQEERVS
jgi:sugar transferase EpsL